MRTKKIALLLLLTIVMFLVSSIVPQRGRAVEVPQNFMEECLKEDNPSSLLQQYFFPFLVYDSQRVLLFAAEMDLSNGPPKTRDFGERYMFGKLVNSSIIMANPDWATEDVSSIEDEVWRLLFGPWANGGNTIFSFSTKSQGKQLVYESGKWVNFKGGPTILIRHTTEFYGINRYLHLSCNYRISVEGNYQCSFNIVR